MSGTIQKWRTCFRKSRGLLTRLFFLLHGITSIALLIVNKSFDKINFLLLIPLGFLFLESVLSLCFDTECKYVWPCGFFYIATIVPVIWILELDLLDARRRGASKTSSAVYSSLSDSGTGNNGRNRTDSATRLLLTTLTTSDENSRRFCEVGVILGLIVGRWFTPGALKGKELSALLLSYVGNAADILELLDSIGTEGVTYNTDVTIGILAVYNWALLQFALITTREKDKPLVPTNSEDVENENCSQESKTLSPSLETSLLIADNNDIENLEDADYGSCKESTQLLQTDEKESSISTCWGYYHQEFPQMSVQMLMQDGPFLLLRLSLCIKYNIINELHIFFLCKNALICILLLYRLVYLLEETKTEKRNRKVQNQKDSVNF